ncbi:SGNH/GDSL hydrolase family protein [Yinghuangia sp. YIM S10712]|uniref:SGNH/GDSL hydrolase family protein n=1 Tax=Yinghuangia sp. YIM S10712 TaxID=3436930 RepID=UPI003F532B3E
MLATVGACSTGSGGATDELGGFGDAFGAEPEAGANGAAQPLATAPPGAVEPTGPVSAATSPPPNLTIPTPATPTTQATPTTVQAPPPSARPTGPYPKPASMAALGDSITRGYDACSIPLKDCPSKSWATGDDVNSQAKQLGVARDAVFNNARTGARMSDLAAQAQKAVGQRVEYVTVLMGANDACRDKESQMTSVADYERQLREGLAVLRQGLPGVRVLVVSVPDIGRLWEVARGERLARAVWSSGICQTMLEDPESTKMDDVERRQRVRDRVTAYNDVLRRVCGEWQEQCRYDGGAVNAHRFGKGDLSRWDWFHPGEKGQGILADLTMRAGFTWRS